MTHDVLDELRRHLGEGAVLAGAAVPARNRSDWSGLPSTDPRAVLMPRTPGEVAAALRVCHRFHQPVIPQGGLTGLCGGGRAGPQEIALSLERLVGIEELDEATATMVVRAGTPLETVQRAAADAGFLCPLDLGARGSCAIGGNLATNAGGNRVIRYGMAREMVLGLEVALADGTLMTSLNRLIKNNAGYDLKQLFVGSEGTLGVITRAVLRLQLAPACTHAALCALPDFAAVLALLRSARQRLGPSLSAFEIMWQDYYELVGERAAGVRVPLAVSAPLYALVETQGTDEDIDGPRFERWLETMLEDGVIADAALARSLADVTAFWGVRDAAAEFRQILGPHQSFDVGLATGRMGDFVASCKAALSGRFPGIVALFYGHIGDGNVHIVTALPGAAQPKEAIEETVYAEVHGHGGSISAEHGIGTTKKRWLPYSRTAEELALMRTLKTALDPRGILNPGKIL